MLERKPKMLVAVVLANKMARAIRAIVIKNGIIRPGSGCGSIIIMLYRTT